MTDPLTEALLAKPVGPTIKLRSEPASFTKQVEVKGDEAAVEVLLNPGTTLTDDAPTNILVEEGLNPDEWEPTGFRTSEWTKANGEVGVSRRYTYARKAAARPSEGGVSVDELLRTLETYTPSLERPEGDHGAVIAIADMQFGKIDGDGVDGTLRRTVDYIERAAEVVEHYRQRFDIGHVHVGWLGDHVEGFVSQGGANVFRTGLTMNEQIRLTRRVMALAMTTYADLAGRLSMVAVPGNHGEPQRFSGKGITRYDDSHDTESLIAVSEAAKLSPAFEHVEFYVPETDEMTVVSEVAGTVVAHAHGHQWRPGKHFDWWKGQAFHNPALHEARLLLAGHLHHEHIDTDGPRKFIQPPALESESTWWRHSTGTTGHPGVVVAITKNGATNIVEVVR